MTLCDIKNNDSLIERMTGFIRCGNIAHAYIFEGGAGTDKNAIADSFAKAVLCKAAGCESCIVCKKINNGNHEDIIYVEKDGLSVRDEAIFELQNKLKKKPYAGERNIAIIRDADTMTARAQNRLLKTLEEPFSGTVIILLSDNTENLAKTILSRCVVFRFNPWDSGEGGQPANARIPAGMLLERKPFYLTKEKVMELAEDRDQAHRLLDSMEIIYGGYLKDRSYSKGAVKAAIINIEKARQNLMLGMNVSYTLKNMILSMEEI